jgi:glycerol-3-phosphate acyltransferase PlsY
MLSSLIPSSLLIAAAYLWGGIPTAYIVARLTSGIDIRNYGSGNVGASNALVHLGAKTGIAVGIFDFIGKGMLPVMLARSLDANLATQVAIGLAAIAGHNWSPYIRFTGGRGVGTAGGTILAFALWHEALIATFLIVALGRLAFKDTGMFTLIAITSLPITAAALGMLGWANRPIQIIAMCALISAILITKRLTANWEHPPDEQPIIHTLICRILWDRDVPNRQNWTKRTPTTTNTEASEQ